MKLGVNSVLFGGFDLETACKHIALAGYDGIELAAIPGMGEHLALNRWQESAPEIGRLAREYGLELLAIEQPSQEPARMEAAFRAAAELGIPIVNCGPGGRSGDESSLQQTIDSSGRLAAMAERYGLTLCVKAHVGASVHDAATMLRLVQAIASPAFGVNLDPSHIYRAGEDPVAALAAVIEHVRHVHIRDCKGRQAGPGRPEEQVNGRGDIDLPGFIRLLHERGYRGSLSLEIIGAREYSLVQCSMIAAEARGHLQACLQACGAR